jgi:type II secretory pathway component PulK
VPKPSIFRSRSRRGVALLTVLMTLVLISALAAVTRASTGAQLHALERNVQTTKARWQAEGCAALGLAELNAAQASSRGTAWNALDSVLTRPRSPDVVRGCVLRVEATGRVLGVGQHDTQSLTRLFIGGGIAPTRAYSLALALSDWIDEDDVAQDGGAESDWYVAAHRAPPRNAGIRSLDELVLVRGFDSSRLIADTLSHLFGVDSVRLSVGRASSAVLRAVPGLSEEAAQQLIRSHLIPAGLRLATHTAGVTRAAAQLLTEVPDGWELVAQIRDESGAAIALQRLWLGRTQTRIAVLRVGEDR